jgi:hypothetical protein
MGEKRPRHEPHQTPGGEKAKTYEPSYMKSESRLAGRAKPIENARRLKDTMSKKSSSYVVSVMKQNLTNSNNELKVMTDAFANKRELETRRLREELQRCRGDLAGTFNDRKLELAATLPRGEQGSPREQELRKLLDWLHFAEEKGELADYLEQWNKAVERQDWDEMALLAEQIKKGIEFDKAILDEWFDQLDNDRKKDVGSNREVLRDLLDGIAFEVMRQADRELLGWQKDPGARMVAAQEALYGICNRRSLANKLAADVKELRPSHEIVAWSRRASDAGVTIQFRGLLDNAKSAVSGWEAHAKNLVNAINEGKHPADRRQREIATELDKLGDLSKAMLGLLDINRGLTGWARDDMVFTLRELAAGIVQRQGRFISDGMITDPKAQQMLKNGEGIKALRGAIAEVDARYKPNTLYADAYAAKDLAGFLGKHITDLSNRLEKESKSNDAVGNWAKTTRATLFKDVFDEHLDKKLKEWNARKDENIYGLAWQLTATLRRYQAGVQRVLDPSKAPSTLVDVAENAIRALDAAVAAVARDLDGDVEAKKV